MAAVAVPQHIPTSRVAQAASAARTHLTLTHFSLQLLLSFLHSARLTLVLSIVNEHTDFEVRAASPEGPLWADSLRGSAGISSCAAIVLLALALRRGYPSGSRAAEQTSQFRFMVSLPVRRLRERFFVFMLGVPQTESELARG